MCFIEKKHGFLHFFFIIEHKLQFHINIYVYMKELVNLNNKMYIEFKGIYLLFFSQLIFLFNLIF